MPDWNKLVHERLGVLDLPSIQQAEVVNELAAHLEDLYQERLEAGMSESQALESVCTQNPDWILLVKNIERAKNAEGVMNNRTKQLWLPALICLTAYMGLMMALQIIGTKLLMPWRHETLAWLPYTVWIVTLPLIGAFCGSLSRRAGSATGARILVALFPALVVIFLCVFILGVLAVLGLPFYVMGLPHVLLHMVLIPSIALLAGTLPFLKRSQLDPPNDRTFA